MATKAGLLPFGLCGPISLCCEHEYSHWPAFFMAGRYSVYWYPRVSHHVECLIVAWILPIFQCTTTWVQLQHLNYLQGLLYSFARQQYGLEHLVSRILIFDQRHRLLLILPRNDSSIDVPTGAQCALSTQPLLYKLDLIPIDRLWGCTTDAEGSQSARLGWYMQCTRIWTMLFS